MERAAFRWEGLAVAVMAGPFLPAGWQVRPAAGGVAGHRGSLWPLAARAPLGWLAPPPAGFSNILKRNSTPAAQTQTAPGFDFVAEMHDTRVTVDGLLAQGKIDEAEAFMEARRRVMWNNGYQIRKLNQAYFAFYGAYASAGGGAAGSDPVGGAVKLLRRRSSSIAEFVNIMATFSTFEQLESYLNLPVLQ